MNKLRFFFSKTLLAYCWQEFLVRYRFKFVLPRMQHAIIDGIYLDLSRLSLKVRNRISMGIYEAHEKQLCRAYLQPDDSVLEIGGAIGFIGLYCQKHLGIKSYAVFEANPATLEILRRNFELNGVAPAAWHLALAPTEGELELEIGTDFWENSLVCAQLPAGQSQTVRVPGAPLRTLLKRAGRTVNVLIIDIEGAEQFIDLDEIPAEVDKIIIELHPHVLGPEKTYHFIAGLIERGFYVAKEESGTFAFLRRAPLTPSKDAALWQAAPPPPAALAAAGAR